jgi:hypothetical protein
VCSISDPLQVEGFPLEDFSADAVKHQIAEAQKIADGSGSEADVAEAKVELDVSQSRRLIQSNMCIGS